jgi:hypothetical protein
VNDRPSQHSYANARDISAFVPADGRAIDSDQLGPDARDRQAQAKTAMLAGGDARPLRDVDAATVSSTKETQFLRRMHESTCGILGRSSVPQPTRSTAITSTWTLRPAGTPLLVNNSPWIPPAKGSH